MTNRLVLSRRHLLRAGAALAAVQQLGCAAESGRPPVAQSGGAGAGPGTPAPRAYDAFVCDEEPAAYVLWVGQGPRLTALQRRLERVGFVVYELPFDRSPAELRGVIVLPSYASADAAYSDYMKRHGAELYGFVDGANLLLQLPQDADMEPSPPFLPTTHSATRGAAATGEILVESDTHPLLASAQARDGKYRWSEAGDDVPVFVRQDGFAVVLSDESGSMPVLLEGAYGQGRFVLSALSFDAEDADEAVTRAFFHDLRNHARAVCGRSAAALTLSEEAGLSVLTPGSSLIAVLPDTQVYSLRFPGLYHAQTSFLCENAERLDLRYVVHLGDIVNNNTHLEWQRASQAMAVLHDVVPYALAPGNHDYGPSGDASTRDTFMNDYFDFGRTAAMPSFGGAYEMGKLDNSYHLFSVKDRDFVLIALEWGPRDALVEWADGIMRRYPERDGIFVTHAYLNNDDRRYDHTDKEHSQRFNPHEYATPGGVNDGEELWQKLVRHHRFVMTLNGHVLGDGCGYLVSTTDRGNRCHQMLSNYQMREQGGEAYMRLLEFLDDGKTVRVHTYSPLYDRMLDEPGHNFELTLD